MPGRATNLDNNRARQIAGLFFNLVLSYQFVVCLTISWRRLDIDCNTKQVKFIVGHLDDIKLNLPLTLIQELSKKKIKEDKTLNQKIEQTFQKTTV